MCSPERYSDLPCDKTGNKLAGLLWSHSRLYSKLESQFLTCIQYIPSRELPSLIRVQGEHQRVSDTMSQLHSMLDLIDPSPPPSLSPPPPPLGDERDSVNAGLLRAMLSTVERKAAVSPPFLPPSYHHHHQQYPHLIPRNSPEFPLNREKVDYYVQLGFQQEIVESTIASLGPGAHDNDIMHRLNMRGKVIPPPRPVEEVMTPGMVTTGTGSIGDREVLQRRVMDPSNPRPIVVDGSNVAMRYVTMLRLMSHDLASCITTAVLW